MLLGQCLGDWHQSDILLLKCHTLELSELSSALTSSSQEALDFHILRLRSSQTNSSLVFKSGLEIPFYQWDSAEEVALFSREYSSHLAPLLETNFLLASILSSRLRHLCQYHPTELLITCRVQYPQLA